MLEGIGIRVRLRAARAREPLYVPLASVRVLLRIDEHHVGPKVDHQLNALLTGVRLTDDLQVGRREQLHEGVPNQILAIHQDEGDLT